MAQEGHHSPYRTPAKPWEIRHLRGIGFRYVWPDGLERRCWQCNAKIDLLTRRCDICGGF
jgi:hypothetical protein